MPVDDGAARVVRHTLLIGWERQSAAQRRESLDDMHQVG